MQKALTAVFLFWLAGCGGSQNQETLKRQLVSEINVNWDKRITSPYPYGNGEAVTGKDACNIQAYFDRDETIYDQFQIASERGFTIDKKGLRFDRGKFEQEFKKYALDYARALTDGLEQNLDSSCGEIFSFSNRQDIQAIIRRVMKEAKLTSKDVARTPQQEQLLKQIASGH